MKKIWGLLLFDGEKEEVSLLGVGKKGVLSCLPAGVFVFSLRIVCCGPRGGVVDENGCLKVSGR